MMDNIREKLVELIHDSTLDFPLACYIADDLIANGVTVLPVQVGSTVYQTDGVNIYESTVKKLIYAAGWIDFDEEAIGKSVFLTREEAEEKRSKMQRGE